MPCRKAFFSPTSSTPAAKNRDSFTQSYFMCFFVQLVSCFLCKRLETFRLLAQRLVPVEKMLALGLDVHLVHLTGSDQRALIRRSVLDVLIVVIGQLPHVVAGRTFRRHRIMIVDPMLDLALQVRD